MHIKFRTVAVTGQFVKRPPNDPPLCCVSVRRSLTHLSVCLQEKNWRNRRSQKLDKMELLTLQSSLQSEIQAKQSISGELSHCRAELIASQK